MSLQYEPVSEPLHIYVKKLFFLIRHKRHSHLPVKWLRQDHRISIKWLSQGHQISVKWFRQGHCSQLPALHQITCPSSRAFLGFHAAESCGLSTDGFSGNPHVMSLTVRNAVEHDVFIKSEPAFALLPLGPFVV